MKAIIFLTLLIISQLGSANNSNNQEKVERLINQVDHLIGMADSEDIFVRFPSPSLQARNLILLSLMGLKLRSVRESLEHGQQWSNETIQAELSVLRENLQNYSALLENIIITEQANAEELAEQMELITLSEQLFSPEVPALENTPTPEVPASSFRFYIDINTTGDQVRLENDNREGLYQACLNNFSNVSLLYSVDTYWEGEPTSWRNHLGWSPQHVCLSLALYAKDALVNQSNLQYRIRALINGLPLEIEARTYNQILQIIQHWIPRFELSGQELVNLSLNGIGPIDTRSLGISGDTLLEIFRYNIKPQFPCHQVSGRSVWVPPYNIDQAIPFTFFGNTPGDAREMARAFLSSQSAGRTILGYSHAANSPFHSAPVANQVGMVLAAQIHIGRYFFNYSDDFLKQYLDQGGSRDQEMVNYWLRCFRTGGNNPCGFPVTENFFLQTVEQEAIFR